jgi:hypothetical protein
MITKTINKILKKQYILVTICFVFLLVSQIQAQPAGNRAVDYTEVENINGCSIITVTFVFPVQYLSHFPKSHGKELRVQFSPLITAQSNIAAEISNEAIRLMDDVEVPIKRFEYNGGQFTEKPSLWLIFSEPVYFKVEQGADFRSLKLYLSTKSLEACD